MNVFRVSMLAYIGLLSLCPFVSEVCRADETTFAPTVATARVVDMATPPVGLVQWSSEIGNSAGQVRVFNDQVWLGTNNDRQPHRPDSGVMQVLDRLTGTPLGSLEHLRLTERAFDLPTQAIRSVPTLAKDGLVYYISNRGELVCVSSSKVQQGQPEWTLDMRESLGVIKRDASDIGNPTSSPLLWNDLVICGTGHCVQQAPGTSAPSALGVHRRTGQVAWAFTMPIKDVIFGQWGSPELITWRGTACVIFPAGNGWLHGLSADTGELLWSLDGNRPERTPGIANRQGTRSFFDSKPIVRRDMIYIAMSHGVEADPSVAPPILAIDTHASSGTNAPEIRWRYESSTLGQATGNLVLDDDRILATTQAGYLLALDAHTGQPDFQLRLSQDRALLSSPTVVQDHLLVTFADELQVLTNEPNPCCLFRYQFQETIENSATVSGDSVFITTRGHVWRLNLATVLRGPPAPASDVAVTLEISR